MNFWIFAVILLAVPAIIMSWPFLAGSAKARVFGLILLVAAPLVGIVLYQNIGTPAAINLQPTKVQQAAQSQAPHASDQGQMDGMVAQLQQRMTENPDDAEGWLILGRSLKTMKRYAEAETALANANRLVPGNAMIMVELAEATLFSSGQPEITPAIRQMLESAIEIDPQQQKGLWLLGLAVSQDGEEALAINLWQRLLEQLEPASGAAEAVTQQINKAQERIAQNPPKAAAPAPAPVAAAGVSIPVSITVPQDVLAALPANATLFVFIHPTGGAGMPLAVKRVAARGFPLQLNFSDADLLRPGMSLKAFEQLDISARISMSGIANAASGDYQANRVTFNSNIAAEIALHLDQRVP